MKVSGIQFDIAWEDPGKNFKRVEPLLARAAEGGSVLTVLPEMFATGFSMDEKKAASFAADTRKFLSDAARRFDFWLLGGFIEPFHPKPRNVCALFDPSGEEKLLYSKIHPFTLAGEHDHYQPGDEVVGCEVEGVRVTPFICYDLRFPEPFRIAAADTDLFVVVANWPVNRIGAWTCLLRARALENQCFVLGVNRVGEGEGLHFSGESALIDPMGDSLCEAREGTALIEGDVNPEVVEVNRQELSFLEDRRHGAYKRIEARYQR